LILLDANVLLYAYDASSPMQARAARWLEEALEGNDPVGLPWVAAWAFVRISTNPRVQERPLLVDEAMGVIDELKAHAQVVMVGPGRRHWSLLAEQMRAGNVRGSGTTDAVLAALALEQGARLASADVGFRRFPEVVWVNPFGAA
jgi:uncharacterized protein